MTVSQELQHLEVSEDAITQQLQKIRELGNVVSPEAFDKALEQTKQEILATPGGADILEKYEVLLQEIRKECCGVTDTTN